MQCVEFKNMVQMLKAKVNTEMQKKKQGNTTEKHFCFAGKTKHVSVFCCIYHNEMLISKIPQE